MTRVLIVSQWEGLKNKVGNKSKLLYAKGCDIEGNSKAGFAEAVKVAKQADIVVLRYWRKARFVRRG